MQMHETEYRRLSSLMMIILILIAVFVLVPAIRPVVGQSELLVDSEFDGSTDSADLRANNPSAFDWFESRGGFSGGNSGLLVLNETSIAGNGGKKASLANYGIAQNAYLTQNFSSAQTGVFSVSFHILIDRIQDNANYDRTGHIFIGDDRYTANAITGTADERYVLLAFYDSTPGDTGNDVELRARTLNTAVQSWTNTTSWVQVTTGLSYDVWYAIRIELNVAGGTYDVYVDGVLKGDDIPKMNGYTPSSVEYITFALDSDARGDFCVDNVFSPARDAAMKVVSSATDFVVGQEISVYINVTDVIDLYGWEFQLDYDPSVLDLTYNATVTGGLNSPLNIFKDTVDETTGHLWWAVSTSYPTTTGTSYSSKAIFEMRFTAMATGTSNLDLSGTILSNSRAIEIPHTVVNGTVHIETLDLRVTDLKVCNMHANETWVHSIYANDSYSDLADYYYPVNVTIQNTGTLSATNFKVKLEVYYDLSLEASSEQMITVLADSSTKELTFGTVFRPTKTGNVGRYSLKATVDSENSVTEDNEYNNDKTKNDFTVTVMGDINGDRTVNILDGVRISLAWTATPSHGHWNVAADLNHDDEVNVLDAVRISLYWGSTW